MHDKAEIEAYMADAIGIVEANSFEQISLWKEHKDEWKEHGSGHLVNVGRLADMPVCISLLFAHVRGDKILFYSPTSSVVDHRLIDAWLKVNLPKSCWWQNHINRHDAMNFCNVFLRRRAA